MNKGIRNTIAFGVGYVIIKWASIFVMGGALYKRCDWNNGYLLAIPIIGKTSLIISSRIKTHKNKKNVCGLLNRYGSRLP